MSLSPPGPDVPVLTPSELNQAARIHLEAGFSRLWVSGEISNLAKPTSGHLYFSLKDGKAQLRCALFKRQAVGLSFDPANGDQVLVRGRLSLYEPRGDYQLISDGLLPAGAGALQAAFEALKTRLSAAGLFDEASKKPLPQRPQRIAVVTSPGAAALRDIARTLANRWPLAQVRLYPSLVQGDQAAPELIRALQAADRDGFAEVIILARGGGSLEDLWAFNDEALAHALAAINTPVVCGVGHETDFTIADFVADLRAPTPTAAAVAVTPDGQAELAEIRRLMARAQRRVQHQLDEAAQRHDRLLRRLQAQHPQQRLLTLSEQLQRLQRRLTHSGHHSIVRHRQRLETLGRALHSLSPLAVLERGYGVLMDPEGRAITRREELIKGMNIKVLMHEFEVEAEVKTAAQARAKNAPLSDS
jgi:exodeoxyribonuclease VII large subunit